MATIHETDFPIEHIDAASIGNFGHCAVSYGGLLEGCSREPIASPAYTSERGLALYRALVVSPGDADHLLLALPGERLALVGPRFFAVEETEDRLVTGARCILNGNLARLIRGVTDRDWTIYPQVAVRFDSGLVVLANVADVRPISEEDARLFGRPRRRWVARSVPGEVVLWREQGDAAHMLPSRPDLFDRCPEAFEMMGRELTLEILADALGDDELAITCFPNAWHCMIQWGIGPCSREALAASYGSRNVGEFVLDEVDLARKVLKVRA